LNVPGDEQPGWPSKLMPPNNYCASHYAAYYDLFSNPSGQLVGTPGNATVPCAPAGLGDLCPSSGARKLLPNNKSVPSHMTFGSPYTCMISGGG
jgi:hypothetical protein